MADFRKFLTREGAKEMIRRWEILRRAIRVLDLEMLCRFWQLERRVDDIEKAGLGGNLDDYLTKKEAADTYQEKLNYYTEGNRDAVMGGTDTADEESGYASVETDLMEGSVTISTGEGHDAEHTLTLDSGGNLTLDGAAVLTGDTLVAGDNVTLTDSGDGRLVISAAADWMTDDEVRELFDED